MSIETQDLQSLGHAAGTYQRAPKLIAIGLKMAAAEKAQATGEPMVEPEPAIKLNGVAYYAESDIINAITSLARHDAEQAQRKAADE